MRSATFLRRSLRSRPRTRSPTLEAGHDPKGGRLPAAARTKESEELAALEGDVELAEGHDVASEALVQVLQLEVGHYRAPPICTWRRPRRPRPRKRIPSIAIQVIPKLMIESAPAGFAYVCPT